MALGASCSRSTPAPTSPPCEASSTASQPREFRKPSLARRDRLKAYGLAPPHVSLEFQLKSGAKHTVLLGDKDFTGVSVYSVIDGGRDVSLLPLSLDTSADKPFDELRDRNVLHIDNGKVASFELKNSSGDLSAVKQGTKDQPQWKFRKPGGDILADAESVNALLAAVATTKMTSITSETSDNLAKYGLSNPAVTFSAVDEAGQKLTLLVGKKEGSGYLARDASRPTIFVINDDLYKKLSETFADLRDKNLVHVTESDISHIEIHNANATMAVSRKQGSDFDWTDRFADRRERQVRRHLENPQPAQFRKGRGSAGSPSGRHRCEAREACHRGRADRQKRIETDRENLSSRAAILSTGRPAPARPFTSSRKLHLTI